jgi:GNAT superfamily N-acetyltransferase
VGKVRVIVASPRERCAEWLSADIAIDAPTGHVERLRECRAHLANAPRPHADSITISNGTINDYRAMARWHYRAGAPATCVRVLAAKHGAETIGVLVVSMPTLNGAWRERAWPGCYTGARVSKQTAAARLNRDIRCISRVIVDPRYRGRGVGARLVRHYLQSPLTRRTEAVAAMGAASPMFTRAGMREWIGERTKRDSRLIDGLHQANLRPWYIADVRAMVRRAHRDRSLEKALRAWAMKHGATRRLTGGPIEDIIAAAARSIVQRPRAYTADR